MIADGHHPLPDSAPADQDALDPDVFADHGVLTELTASTDLTDLGSVDFGSVHLGGHLDGDLDPALDIDGDGVGELTTIDTDDGLVVLGDHDHDGLAEHLTVVDRSGDFATWEFCTAEDGSMRWERTTGGTVGGI